MTFRPFASAKRPLSRDAAKSHKASKNITRTPTKSTGARSTMTNVLPARFSMRAPGVNTARRLGELVPRSDDAEAQLVALNLMRADDSERGANAKTVYSASSRGRANLFRGANTLTLKEDVAQSRRSLRRAYWLCWSHRRSPRAAK